MGTSLVARIWVELPAGSSDLRILRKRVSFSGVHINGEAFGSCSTSGTLCPWCFCDQTAPWSYSGSVLVIVTQDSYPWNVSWTYMDVQMSADVPPVLFAAGPGAPSRLSTGSSGSGTKTGAPDVPGPSSGPTCRAERREGAA